MEEVFIQKHDVNPNLVADVHQYIYKSSGTVHPIVEQLFCNCCIKSSISLCR